MTLTTKKLMIYIVGIIILTLGVTLTIQSRMGASPFDALLVGLYRTIGLTVGSWEIIVSFIMVFLNALLKRNRPEYLALFTAFITGMGIDFWLFLLREWIHPETMIFRSLCFGIGMLVIGFGTATYLKANVAPSPFDRSMLVIRDLTGLSLTYSRAILSVIIVTLAFIFKGPIGIGTLLIALFSGVIVQFFMSHTMKKSVS